MSTRPVVTSNVSAPLNLKCTLHICPGLETGGALGWGDSGTGGVVGCWTVALRMMKWWIGYGGRVIGATMVKRGCWTPGLMVHGWDVYPGGPKTVSGWSQCSPRVLDWGL